MNDDSDEELLNEVEPMEYQVTDVDSDQEMLTEAE